MIQKMKPLALNHEDHGVRNDMFWKGGFFAARLSFRNTCRNHMYFHNELVIPFLCYVLANPALVFMLKRTNS
jgi:hypothetical protein